MLISPFKISMGPPSVFHVGRYISGKIFVKIRSIVLHEIADMQANKQKDKQKIRQSRIKHNFLGWEMRIVAWNVKLTGALNF